MITTRQPYRSSPDEIAGTPRGIPFIIANEAAERYSYYGMRAILVLFMTHYMVDAAGAPDHLSDPQARAWYHTFVSAVYLTPLLGALISDIWWGKYKTIITLSLVYCAGHLALALNDTRIGLLIGLGLIALGSGGIKPCVSAHVGDQFASTNQHLLSKVYGWFYISINIGASISMIVAEPILQKYGPRLAFGIPGVFMALATLAFWLGRYRYAHVPPAGKVFVRDAISVHGRRLVTQLFPIYATMIVYWSLNDQTGSSWVQQAQAMNRHFIIDWGPTQMQWLNPVMVIIFVPTFSRWLYPAISRVWPLTPLRKIGIGMSVATSSFLVSAWLQHRIDLGQDVNVAWQIISYALLTSAEVMIYVTGLELSYTQAPKSMKSLVMAFYLATIALGNLFTSAVNFWIEKSGYGNYLSGANYYLFFAATMFLASLVFVPVARSWRDQTTLQG